MFFRNRMLGAFPLALGLGAALFLAGQSPASAHGVVYKALSKNVEARGNHGDVIKHECKLFGAVAVMAQTRVKLEAVVSSNADCDECKELDGKAILNGVFVLRTAPGIEFGTHDMVGVLTNPAGRKFILVFDGTLNCGTHRVPVAECERCRVENHMEGCLKAYVRNADGSRGALKARATYAGKWQRDPAGGTGLSLLLAIDGVCIHPCVH